MDDEKVPEPAASHRGVQVRRTGDRPKRIVALSGAKGGAGKTVLASNLAIYLASLGRSVVVVDADAAGAHLHTLLGVPPSLTGYADPDASLEVKETPVAGLYFVEGGLAETSPGGPPLRTRRQLFDALADIDTDYMVLDLGSGIAPELLDAYLGAELSAYVTVPEPAAVEGTYRFIRALYLRKLRQAPETEEERSELESIAQSLGGLPSPHDLARELERRAHPLSDTANALLDAFRIHVLVNQTRVRADLELGENMRSAVHQRLGVEIDYLGYVDYDDTVWTCVRERQPLLIKSPSTKASKNIERIARRLLAIDAGKWAGPPQRSVPEGSHHDLLEVDRGATDDEVRRAYRRARDVYAEGSLCCYGLFSDADLESLRARLEEAYDVLLDRARRRPYELSVFPRHERTEEEAAERTRELDPRPPAPTITPQTQFDGSLLRAVRESQGLDMRQIARRTKIGMPYLQAIEDDEFEKLPALVYVRGFVTEMAKCLHLDPEQVSHSYVRRLKRSLGEPGA